MGSRHAHGTLASRIPMPALPCLRALCRLRRCASTTRRPYCWWSLREIRHLHCRWVRGGRALGVGRGGVKCEIEGGRIKG